MLDEKKIRVLSEAFGIELEDDMVRRMALDAKLCRVVEDMRAEMSTVEIVGELIVKAYDVMHETRGIKGALLESIKAETDGRKQHVD